MKLTKSGNLEKVKKYNPINLKCAICGAEYTMKREEYENINSVRLFDCEYCGLNGTVERILETLNE